MKVKQPAKQHRKVVKKSVKCKKCEKIFESRQAMLSHFRQIHHVRITFDKCSICSKSLSSRFAGVQHYQNVHSVSVQMCQHCDFGYVNYETFRKHLRTKHPEQNRVRIEKQKKKTGVNNLKNKNKNSFFFAL